MSSLSQNVQSLVAKKRKKSVQSARLFSASSERRDAALDGFLFHESSFEIYLGDSTFRRGPLVEDPLPWVCFVLLFLLLCALGGVFGLTLLTRGAVILAGCVGAHGCVFSFFVLTVGVLSLGSAGGCVACVFCFFFLALFPLFLLNALPDVCLSLLPEYRAFAMVAADESPGNIHGYAADNSPLVSFLVESTQPCLEQHLQDDPDNA